MELYNLPIERTALSSLLSTFTPDDLDDMLGVLREDLFYLPAHQHIYNAVLSLVKDNKPIDDAFLQMVLEKEGQWDENVMLEIISTTPAAKIETYADQLKELQRKRSMLELTNAMKKMILEDHASADDVQAMLELELQNAETQSGVGKPITMSQAIREYDGMTEPPKIATGIRKIDEMLCDGFEPTQLIHLGGERNIGKTTLLKQVLYNTSAGHDSLFFSFEMPAWKMAKYTKKMTGPADLNRYRIIDTQMMKSRDVMDVARMIRSEWRKNAIRFVLIDSKMKLTHKTFKGSSDSDRKGDIDAVLNAVVQETGVVVMMIVQLSKDDIKNGSMSSYGSGLSDYEADMQLMMYRSSDGNTVELKVSKNRQEVLHEPVQLWLNTEELKFEDIRHVEVNYETAPDDAGYTMSQESFGGVNEMNIEVNVI